MTKTQTGSEKVGTNNVASSLLPLAPRTLCFDKNEFMKTDFSVDNFVADCRRRVRLETLRQDLEIYFKLLKNAMIELINKDYADFVNLSTNLVGMDKAIGQLRQPLRKIKEDVSEVEVTIQAKVVEVEAAFEQQRALTEKRKLLGHMQGLLQAVDKIEHIQRSEESKSGQVLERIAGEFNQLQHHATYCKGLPVLTQIRQRVAEITSKLQSSLERELVQGMSNGDTKQVHRCLNSYALISKTHDAESLVRIHVVEPFVRQIIEEQNENVNINQLKTMFVKLLELVPNHLKVLCDVTSGRKNRLGEQFRGIPGYDFVVNSAWPQIVSSLERGLSQLFESRDPNDFHKRYLVCMEFVSNFERQCGSQASITRLRQSDSYNTLMTHWSLPVYFQIRFQEIGGKLELALEQPAQPNKAESKVQFRGNRTNITTGLIERWQDKYPSQKEVNPFSCEVFFGVCVDLFRSSYPKINILNCSFEEVRFVRLHSSCVLWQSMESCWKENIFLPALIHRFWKLTLQLIARYGSWVTQVYTCQVSMKNESKNKEFVELSLNQLASLIVDVDLVASQSLNLFTSTIEPKVFTHGFKNTSNLKDALQELLNTLTNHKVSFEKHIIDSLCAASLPYLKQAQDVPRLFRKTNRPAPVEPSVYINGVTKPVVAFCQDQAGHVDTAIISNWLSQFAATICERYYAVVSDVLTSVRKMEESLMRLQKLRSGKFSSGNLSSLASGSDSLSDDDKIRLQLYLDVVSFGDQMMECGADMEEVSKYQELLKMVEAAKTKADAI